jgi:uncharacterized protein (UPF0261 family)
MATVILLGTFDTKGAEYAFLRDTLEAAGCDVTMINAGVLGEPDYPIEYDRSAVARAAGSDIARLSGSGDRGAAVTTMAEGAAEILQQLLAAGKVHGVLGAGGSGGTAIISRAMRQLPVGLPKLLVSTMASGDIRPYVDVSDTAMMYSVVDIAGINSISRDVLANAATAVAAMARAYEGRTRTGSDRPVVGATMYGTTTPCVDIARHSLVDAGYEVLVFHANGSGGRAMERLITEHRIIAALDITTTELIDEIAGSPFSAGPDRLEAAGRLGIPQVVSLGGTDQITLQTPVTRLPEQFAERIIYAHNPNITLVRTTEAECVQLGEVIAEKLNRATGPVTVFIPRRGTSMYGIAGGVFHDPVADEALFETLICSLHESIEVVDMDTDINDPAFGAAMAARLVAEHRAWLDAGADSAATGT